jgi:hypothetical protein
VDLRINEGSMTKRVTLAIATLLLAIFHAPLFAQDAPPPQLVIVDLRPTEEKEGTGLAALEGKCNKDVYRVADVATSPLKVDVLREDLTQVEWVGGGKTLTVLNWSIYYNKQVQKSGGGLLQSVGVQGYNIPTAGKKERRAGSRCTQRDTAGGWYDGSEIHSAYYPLISEFTGTYGGKPVKVRVVYSPRVKLAGKFAGGEDDTQALLELVHQTSEAVVGAIVQ